MSVKINLTDNDYYLLESFFIMLIQDTEKEIDNIESELDSDKEHKSYNRLDLVKAKTVLKALKKLVEETTLEEYGW